MLFLYSKRLYEQNNITTDNSVTNTWSILQTHMFHDCTIKQNVEPWKLSTSWGHTKVLFFMLLTFKLLKLSYTRCFVMWYIYVIFIKFIKFTTYEIVLIWKFSTVFSFTRHTWNMMWHIFWRHWRMTSKVRKVTSRNTKN